MRKHLIAMIVTGCAAGLSGPVAAQDMSALVDEAKGIMGQFGDTLKGALMAAVEEGGPAHAIGVCNERAPEIAAEIELDSGWTVARSSHLIRNPDNTPDLFTANVIEDFLARQAAGEAAADLVHAEIVEEDGQQVFRLVKAIPTGELCLNCHGGDEVRPEVEARLAELYPSDQARGFVEGEMRGVFTLSRVLDD